MRPLRRTAALLVLIGTSLLDLVASSLSVARIVLARTPRQAPAVIVIPVDARTPWGVALLAYFISLTPGSTCIHVSDDRRRLFVHMLDAPSDAAAINRVKRLYERWVLELER